MGNTGYNESPTTVNSQRTFSLSPSYNMAGCPTTQWLTLGYGANLYPSSNRNVLLLLVISRKGWNILKWLLTNFHNQKALYYIGQNISHGTRIHPPLNSLILLKIAQCNQVSFTVNFSKPIALKKEFQKRKYQTLSKILDADGTQGKTNVLTKHLCNWFKPKCPKEIHSLSQIDLY